LPGSDAIIASFKQACGSLRAGLVDLLALIEEQYQACATYQTAVRTNYKPSMLSEFPPLVKEWTPYASKMRETWAQVTRLSDDIIVSSMKQPTVSKGSKRCIIM
jgi:hypothetical protein